MDTSFATRERIADVEKRIRPYIRKTPVIEIDGADFGVGGVTLIFKLELCQHAGSFKARGAFANLLLRNPGPAGVAAASGGNHGVAVAYAASKLGIPAKVFVPEISSPAKVERIRAAGADLVIGGAAYQDALEACNAHVADTGALNVHAYDAPETILGAGSVGLEFEEQAPGLDMIIVAVGGGGLISGVSAWMAGKTRIVGVESDLTPCFSAALAAGRPVDAPVSGVAADSLGAKRMGDYTFAVAASRVETSVLVSDGAIIAAQKALWAKLRIAAEPGAAAPLAALLSGAVKPPPNARLGVLVCGGNTPAVNFNQ